MGPRRWPGPLVLSLWLLAACWHIPSAPAWQQWSSAGEASAAWRSIWCAEEEDTCASSNGPGERFGHSLILDTTRAVLFGGRSSDVFRVHEPTTFEVEDVNGSINIKNYEKPVYDCKYWLRKEQFVNPNATLADINCSELTASRSLTETSTLWNDVWMYDLNCSQASWVGCAQEEWQLLHPGARDCKNYLGSALEICSVPSERYFHGAAVFNDSTMLVYGGFSHRCEDYCDDMWSFQLRGGVYTWTEIHPLDHFRWSAHSSPGKRWKFSLVFEGNIMLLFGGMRLWHGFASENSAENGWSGRAELPTGGFMDDLWVFEKRLLNGDQDPENYASNVEQAPVDPRDIGRWFPVEGGSSVHFEGEEGPQRSGTCSTNQGDSFPTPWHSTGADSASPSVEVPFELDRASAEARPGRLCDHFWPQARAGHAAVLDTSIGGMWLYGGYTTHYPYLSTNGAGSRAGVGGASLTRDSRVPTSHQFYLDDLWLFNISTGSPAQGRWRLIRPASRANPSPRMEHVLVATGQILILHGGFYLNNHMSDTWLFNVTSKRWLEKRMFVSPKYPENCTDDLDYIHGSGSDCFALRWPKELERGASPPYPILADLDQTWYTPFNDSATGEVARYYGIVDKGERITLGKLSPRGTPVVPHAKTGPQQYVRNASLETAFLLGLNDTHNATVYERCTSVQGQPTRNTLLDGKYGRAATDIFVPQPRRRRPGWDGCRDRWDNRSDLPDQGLQWERPSQRSAHAAVFSPIFDVMLVFGGRGPPREEPSLNTNTPDTTILSDFWQFAVHDCPNNCSNHGNCSYGYCTCDEGFYGMDCSNVSCPGDYCFYDEETHQQVCQHCCSAGYNHSDYDVFVDRADIRKVPCSADEPGLSHGVCDGFGTCQCAPPFLGKDCSIKDCPDNCNYNGWCSVEYPVSRCVCNPTYFGETCQYTECLNNCSFPNGVCDYATGECKCQRLYSPYNNTRVFRTDWGVEATWEGEDCSWLTAYSAAPASRRPARLGLLLAWPLFMAAVLLLSAFLGKAAPHYELPPVSPELVREAMLARELRIHSVGPGDHTEK